MNPIKLLRRKKRWIILVENFHWKYSLKIKIKDIGDLFDVYLVDGEKIIEIISSSEKFHDDKKISTSSILQMFPNYSTTIQDIKARWSKLNQLFKIEK